MGKRRHKSGPAFVQLYRWMLDTPAWRDLDPVARALYVEIKRHYSGANNGSIGYGARQAGEALGVHYSTAARAFDRLKEHGFIVAAAPGCFGRGYHLQTEWLITEAHDDRNGHAASKDFMRWSPVALVQPKNRLQVANSGSRVAPVQPDGSGIPHTVAPVQPNGPISPSHRLHQRNTSTSSHRQGAAQAIVVAPPHVGRVDEDGQASGPIPVGEALLNSPIGRKLVAGGRK